MAEPAQNGGSMSKKNENAESSVNQPQTPAMESTKQSQSRRELLLAWQAEREAKKVAAKQTAMKATPRKDPFAIVPSAIHSKCKDHSVTSAPSCAPNTTLLRQQHAAQASKLLNAHTPSKTHPSVPQTAPRPMTSQKRTSIATDVLAMPALMTPQAKAKRIAAKQTSSSSTAPSAVQTPQAPSSIPTIAETESNLTSSEQVAPKAEVEVEKSEHLSEEVVNEMPKSSSASTPTLTENQQRVFRHNPIWKGMVDGLAIKLLEMAILRKCIEIVTLQCPREGDDVDTLMDKYVFGKKVFDELEPSFQNMMSMIANRVRPVSGDAIKPFKTCFYYLYRALFEEFHEQIPEATACFEKAIESGVEPRSRVMSAFKHFCGRIRELTQQQMGLRQSLAIGVRKMQVQEGIADETTQDAQALVDLLEEEVFDDFEEPEMDDSVELEMQDADEIGNAKMDSFHSAQGPEIHDMSDEDLPSHALDALEGEEVMYDAMEGVEEALEEKSEFMAVESASPSNALASPMEESRPVCSFNTPSRRRVLSQTPLGKARRVVMFEDEDEPVSNTEISSFSVVYETSKPSKRTRQIVEGDKVVTPMRRSNRIALPLRDDQSHHASDLLPQSDWSYQPNSQLFASGRMETITGPKPTPKKHSHLVPLSAASERLAQLNATPSKTPSRMGPPIRIPVTFNDEEDEDTEISPSITSTILPTSLSSDEVDTIAVDLQQMEMTVQKPVETPVEDVASISPLVSSDEAEEPSVTTKTPAKRATKRSAAASASKSSRKTASRKSVLPAVEEPSVLESDDKEAIEDVAAPLSKPQQVEEDEDSSLYQSMRKAAYSRSYGSGYVATPSKRREASDDVNEVQEAAVDSTPARRSRRLANMRH